MLTSKRVKKLITHHTFLTAAIVYGPIGIFRRVAGETGNSNALVTVKSAVPFLPASTPVSSRLFTRSSRLTRKGLLAV